MINRTLVDLFCGAGIGAYGFKDYFDIVWAIDNNPYAVHTYNQNIANVAEVADIREVEHFPYADVYVATPPCTSFSTAGKMDGQYNSKTGDLFEETLRAISYAKPKVVIIENVSGLMSKTHIGFFEYVLKQFKLMNYRTTYNLIDCKDFGLAQSRKRVFLVAVREDIHLKKPFLLSNPVSEPFSIREAIGDLPEPDYKNNHYGFGIRKDELPYINKIRPGENWKSLPLDDQRAFMKGAFESGGGKTGFLRKVDFDKTAYTITATMMGKNNAQIVDPDNKYGYKTGYPCRRFTVRECLRLQGVGDDFFFPEKFKDKSVSLSKMYERCSGIPVPAASYLAEWLSDVLGIDY